MDRKYEIERLWNLAISHKKNWQQDNCPIVRGDYGDLEKAWKSATKSMSELQRDDFMKVIESALQKQTLFRAQQRKSQQRVPQPVLVSRWINAKRWKNDVILEGEEDTTKTVTGKCGCGKDININQSVNGEVKGMCWDCHGKLIQTAKSMKL